MATGSPCAAGRGNGYIKPGVDNANISWLNQGTILSQTASRLVVLGGTWRNEGVMRSTAGTLELGGSFTTAGMGSIQSAGGTVSITGTLLNSGSTFELNSSTGPIRMGSGTIVGGRIQTANAQQLKGSMTLVGTTVAGDVRLEDGRLTVLNGITLDSGSINLLRTVGGLGARMEFEAFDASPHVIGGTGTVSFQNSAIAGSFSIGSNVWLRSTNLGGSGGGGILGTLGQPLINQGRIINSLGTVIINGNFDNQGTIQLDVGTSLNLDGGFDTTKLGTILRPLGPTLVQLRGNLNNVGQTFNPDTIIGSLTINGGTVSGGTILSSVTNPLTLNGARLNGVTIGSNLTVSESGTNFLYNGLTLSNSTVTIVSGPDFIAQGGPQTLGGIGTFLINPRFNGGADSVIGGSLTIGPGITIRTGALAASSFGEVVVGTNGENLINQGHLLADSGMTMRIRGNWVNQGSIQLTSGMLFLGGSFSGASLGNFIRGAGTEVWVDGTISGPLHLNASTGSWKLHNGAQLTGGTLTAAGGANLTVRNDSFVRLDNANIGLPILFEAGAEVQMVNGFTMSGGTLTLTGGTQFDNTQLSPPFAAAPQTIGGTGQIIFAGSGDYNYIRNGSGNGTVTIGPGITIRTGTAGGRINAFGGIINRGTISSQTAGQTIYLVDNLQNQGMIQALNGGTIYVATPHPSLISSTGSLLGGSWRADNSSTILLAGSGPTTITTNLASVQLYGPQSSFVAISPIVRNAGELALTGGRDFTTVGGLDSPGALRLGLGSDLILPGPLTLAGTSLLHFELGGVDGEQYGQLLSHDGKTVLGGTLLITLANSFEPMFGDVFQILTAADLDGSFQSVQLPPIESVNQLRLVVTDTSISVEVVPEPVSLTAASLLGAAALLRRRRR